MRLVKKKYYDEVIEQNEKLLDLCKKQQETIKEQKLVIDKGDSIIKMQQQLLDEYRKENLELKKKPLRSVQDLINVI